MQSFPTQSAQFAQHLPAAWAGPAVPSSAPPQGELAAAYLDQTTTRVHWTRILLVGAGLALLAFGLWNALHASDDGAGPVSASVSGSGTGLDEMNAARTPDPTPRTPARQTPRRAVVPAVRPPAVRAPAGAPPVRGGEETLPYTGAETWIAGILGLIVLGLGIVMHVSAVRIGMTALLYRRGILLRPVDCARLARQRGLPRIRVAFSNGLERLLAEPAASEFVQAR